MSKNAGGKIALDKGSAVRFLDNDGCVSDEVFTISTSTTDYKARALLKNDDRNILIHYDRLLPIDSHGKAVCVLGNKSVLTTCPKCKKTHQMSNDDKILDCCSQNFEIHFVPEANKEIEKKDSTFDLNSVLDKCEVWIKDGKFIDGIDLRTVQLIIKDGEKPRKFIFNLYNGKLSATGKNSTLKFKEFFDGMTNDDTKTFWYKIDPLKYENALLSKGYIKHTKTE